jgi:hypothetical protein
MRTTGCNFVKNFQCKQEESGEIAYNRTKILLSLQVYRIFVIRPKRSRAAGT